MSPKTTSSDDELTLFLTHGSGFADNPDWPYSTSRAIPPSIGLPPAKPRVRKIVSVRRLVLAGVAIVLFLLLVSSTKVVTENPCCGPVSLPAWWHGQETVPQPRHSQETVPQPNESPAPRLETFGTRVDFLPSPEAACRQAAGASKLAFILHVSGYFEDPGFT
jgi:hypothetical protein